MYDSAIPTATGPSEWASAHGDELDDNWDRAQALEPLVPIEPLA
jgi:hypothetical protein